MFACSFWCLYAETLSKSERVLPNPLSIGQRGPFSITEVIEGLRELRGEGAREAESWTESLKQPHLLPLAYAGLLP